MLEDDEGGGVGKRSSNTQKNQEKSLVPHPPPVILHERVFILALISIFPLYCEYTSRKNV